MGNVRMYGSWRRRGGGRDMFLKNAMQSSFRWSCRMHYRLGMGFWSQTIQDLACWGIRDVAVWRWGVWCLWPSLSPPSASCSDKDAVTGQWMSTEGDTTSSNTSEKQTSLWHLSSNRPHRTAGRQQPSDVKWNKHPSYARGKQTRGAPYIVYSETDVFIFFPPQIKLS